MSEPIVSRCVNQRQTEEAAAAGQCPHSACLWPPESAAAQQFHQQFQELQASRTDALGRQEIPHVQS